MQGFDFSSLFTQIVQGVQGLLVADILQFFKTLLDTVFGVAS